MTVRQMAFRQSTSEPDDSAQECTTRAIQRKRSLRIGIRKKMAAPGYSPSRLGPLAPERPIAPARRSTMKYLMNALSRSGLLKDDLDYLLIRASMVIVFLLFGYQKWFEYEAKVLIPYIGNGPLISWMYPAFGIRGASWFLGVSEWLFGALLFLGFWNKRLGILGALGSSATFISTVTIIPFMPNGWAASAGGFPAMVGNVPFLMKDVVLLAASVYLLKQDVMRVLEERRRQVN